MNSKCSLFPQWFLGCAAAMLVLSMILPASASSEPTPPETCLVYTVRSTSSYRGYSNDASKYVSLVLVGPPEPRSFETYEDSPIELNASRILNYSPSSSGGSKTYTSYEYEEGRIVGAFSLSKKGASKPSFSLAVGSPYASTSLSGGDIIGKAVFRPPFGGAEPVWHAPKLSSSYRFYDLNPDYDYENPPATMNYFGQSDISYLPATLASGKSTYVLNKKLSALVSGLPFDEASAAVEKWFEDQGYVKDEGDE